MRRILFATFAALAAASPAFAVDGCIKPDTVQIPSNAANLSIEEFRAIHNAGDAYMENAKSYLSCLDQIIYSNAPEDPIVSKAGKAHQEYGSEWGLVWGELNLACVNWEVAHGSTFPGGCQPLNPAG